MQVPWCQGSKSSRNKDPSEFKVGKNTFQKTGAEYQMLYGLAYGLIRVESMYSLRYMATKIGIPGDKVTPSPHWSGVAWLTYLKLCDGQGEDVKATKHIMFTKLQDLEAKSTSALLRDPDVRNQSQSWPDAFSEAAEVKPGSVVFDVVLGPSRGVGVAYFLLQHKKELGQTRHPVSVNIWQPGKTAQPCMVFTISDPPEAAAP